MAKHTRDETLLKEFTQACHHAGINEYYVTTPREGCILIQHPLNILTDLSRRGTSQSDKIAMKEEAVRIAAQAYRFALKLCG